MKKHGNALISKYSTGKIVIRTKDNKSHTIRNDFNYKFVFSIILVEMIRSEDNFKNTVLLPRSHFNLRMMSQKCFQQYYLQVMVKYDIFYAESCNKIFAFFQTKVKELLVYLCKVDGSNHSDIRLEEPWHRQLYTCRLYTSRCV